MGGDAGRPPSTAPGRCRTAPEVCVLDEPARAPARRDGKAAEPLGRGRPRRTRRSPAVRLAGSGCATASSCPARRRPWRRRRSSCEARIDEVRQRPADRRASRAARTEDARWPRARMGPGCPSATALPGARAAGGPASGQSTVARGPRQRKPVSRRAPCRPSGATATGTVVHVREVDRTTRRARTATSAALPRRTHPAPRRPSRPRAPRRREGMSVEFSPRCRSARRSRGRPPPGGCAGSCESSALDEAAQRPRGSCHSGTIRRLVLERPHQLPDRKIDGSFEPGEQRSPPAESGWSAGRRARARPRRSTQGFHARGRNRPRRARARRVRGGVGRAAGTSRSSRGGSRSSSEAVGWSTNSSNQARAADMQEEAPWCICEEPDLVFRGEDTEPAKPG